MSSNAPEGRIHVDPEIRRVKEGAEANLLKRPGVVGVDIGRKEVGGQATNTIAIRVLVAEKKNVSAGQAIPKEINGIPTDVIQRKFELHPIRVAADIILEADTTSYDPLKGGISIGPCRSIGGFIYAGTLGAIVTDNVSGSPMLLSNFHVMCVDNTHAVGDTMVQPSLIDTGSCPGGVVGSLQRSSLGGEVDCAVASHTARGTDCSIVDIGNVAGTNTVSLGQAVRKRGRTTGLTYGVVDTIDLTVAIDYGDGLGTVTLAHQIGIKPDTAHNPMFGDHGDSGSVVLNNGREVVGLYFAGDSTGYGIANPIAAVLTALNVSMCVAKKIEKIEVKEHKLEKFEKFEKNEFKEHKLEKFEVKEHKLEKFEKFEIKEHKLEKTEFEKPPSSEFPIPKISEGLPPGLPGGPGPTGPGLVEQRLSQLEGVVTQLTHFISAGMRPDLSQGALKNEPDLHALSQQLNQQAKAAKEAKDAKDVEKLRE
jgi:hypothetical protein